MREIPFTLKGADLELPIITAYVSLDLPVITAKLISMNVPQILASMESVLTVLTSMIAFVKVAIGGKTVRRRST